MQSSVTQVISVTTTTTATTTTTTTVTESATATVTINYEKVVENTQLTHCSYDRYFSRSGASIEYVQFLNLCSPINLTGIIVPQTITKQLAISARDCALTAHNAYSSFLTASTKVASCTLSLAHSTTFTDLFR